MLCLSRKTTELDTQNGWVQWGHLGPSGPILLQQEQLKQGAQARIQAAFEVLQGDSITSLSNLWQCSITFTAQNCLLMFCANLLFLLSWHWAPLKRAWLHFLRTLHSSIYSHWQHPSHSFSENIKSWICNSDTNKQFHKWLVKTWKVALRNKWHKCKNGCLSL